MCGNFDVGKFWLQRNNYSRFPGILSSRGSSGISRLPSFFRGLEIVYTSLLGARTTGLVISCSFHPLHCHNVLFLLFASFEAGKRQLSVYKGSKR
jgi:hypothetical protein